MSSFRRFLLALVLPALAGVIVAPSVATGRDRDEIAEDLVVHVRTIAPVRSELAVTRAEFANLNAEIASRTAALATAEPLLEERVRQARQMAVSVYIDGDSSLQLAALSAADDPMQWATRLALISPSAQVQALELQPIADRVGVLRRELRELEARRTVVSGTLGVLSDRMNAQDARFRKLSSALTRDTDVSVLGPAVMTAQEMADFLAFRSARWVLPLSRLEFAQMYMDEASAEGVRGDLLIIQGAMESGWFRFDGNGLSDHDDFNFAGINACDSCRSASSFSSVRAGVRAHVQLVKAYADEELTSKNTALPYAYKVENIPVRGCCVMWTDLGKRWASAKGYATRILWTWETAMKWAGHTPPWDR